MIIDNHTHIFNTDQWKQYQEQAEGAISKVVTLPWFNDSNPGWPGVEKLVEFTDRQPDIFAAGVIDMNRNLEQQLKQQEKLLESRKIAGIKLYLGYQHFWANDPRVVAIGQLCGHFNRPLIFHTGDFYDPQQIARLKYSHPLLIDDLAGAIPDTNIVISHFGFPYLLETAMIVSKNQNVFTDISGTIDFDGSQEAVESLTNQYINDLLRVFSYYPGVKQKTMFGSDYIGENTPLKVVSPYLQVIRAIMNEEEQKSAFNGLAQKLYFEDRDQGETARSSP